MAYRLLRLGVQLAWARDLLEGAEPTESTGQTRASRIAAKPAMWIGGLAFAPRVAIAELVWVVVASRCRLWST